MLSKFLGGNKRQPPCTGNATKPELVYCALVKIGATPSAEIENVVTLQCKGPCCDSATLKAVPSAGPKQARAAAAGAGAEPRAGPSAADMEVRALKQQAKNFLGRSNVAGLTTLNDLSNRFESQELTPPSQGVKKVGFLGTLRHLVAKLQAKKGQQAAPPP